MDELRGAPRGFKSSCSAYPPTSYSEDEESYEPPTRPTIHSKKKMKAARLH